jgi:predicted transposase YbfD/YdcC
VQERHTATCALDSEAAGFPHAHQAVRAVRTVTHKKTGAEPTGERYFISSLPWERGGEKQMAHLVRGHWKVENNINWLRDAVQREDTCRCRDRNQACDLALLRTALLALVRAGGHRSLTRAAETFAANKAAALTLIRIQRLALLLWEALLCVRTALVVRGVTGRVCCTSP